MKKLFLYIGALFACNLAIGSYVTQDGSITTAKLASNAVTTVKITNASVTNAKLAALNSATSPSSSLYTNATASYTTVVTAGSLTTVGRPVFISLQSDGSSSGSGIGATVSGSSPTAAATFQILRDSSPIAVFLLNTTSNSSGSNPSIGAPPSAILAIDPGATAGAHTYSLQAKGDSNTTASVTNAYLYIHEL